MTSRSLHYAVKYHWFREHIIPEKIEFVKIETKNQLADILTKGLLTEQFKHGLVTCLMFEREHENNITRRMVGGIQYFSWLVILYLSMLTCYTFQRYSFSNRDSYILRKVETQ